jgi:hypothetical protein
MAKKENQQVTEITERANHDGNLTETTSDWRNIRSICNGASWTSGLFACQSARRCGLIVGRSFKAAAETKKL